MSIHPVMQRLADKLKRTDLPEFVPGDQVRVQVKIKEGEKERLQAFEGLVIAINKGPQGTFTVRKMSFGQGVERIFPFNSKVVDKVEKIRSYKVRRAKLFYLRGLRGKAAELLDAAARLDHSAVDIMRRDHGGAVHPVGRVFAHLLDVVVVGTGDGGGEGGFESVLADRLGRIESEHEEPRDGNSTARSSPSRFIASTCDAASRPARLGSGVDALVL